MCIESSQGAASFGKTASGCRELTWGSEGAPILLGRVGGWTSEWHHVGIV